MAFTSADTTSFAALTVEAEAALLITLSIPQNRFTAVGLVLRRSEALASISFMKSGSLVAFERAAARAKPMAAATPMAGAPRTTMVLMASATCSGRVYLT